jgi:hypothetical protein
LTEPLMYHTVKVTKAKQVEEQQKQDKKRKMDCKLHDEVVLIRSKYTLTWKLREYHVMCRYKKHKGDSPLKKKLQDAMEQWERRKDRESPAKPKGWKPKQDEEEEEEDEAVDQEECGALLHDARLSAKPSSYETEFEVIEEVDNEVANGDGDGEADGLVNGFPPQDEATQFAV